MHLDLLVLKITGILTEGALVWVMRSLKQISFHFKIPQEMNLWFFCLFPENLHNSKNFSWSMTCGSFRTGDRKMSGRTKWSRNMTTRIGRRHSTISSLTYSTSTFQKYLYSHQMETEIVIKNNNNNNKKES